LVSGQKPGASDGEIRKEKQMSSSFKLGERAVLMRLSVGLPGKSRKDKALTGDIQSEHQLGRESGAWVKAKYPKWALEPLEKLVGEARQYHARVTLPFDAGIAILPAGLIEEYTETMREYAGKFHGLSSSHFVARYPEMVEWARSEHNGTFDASDYPPVEELLECFTFKAEATPIPGEDHYAEGIKALLGVDSASVDIRINDAAVEGQRELLKRMIQPVQHMASKLAGAVCFCAACKGKAPASDKFKDTLVENLKEIAGLAPKLNIGGDAQIDAFAREIAGLAEYRPDVLRQADSVRDCAQKQAAALLAKMNGYKL
jgi:hypothetical protein